MKYNNLLWFSLGAAISGAVTYVVVREKYTTIMNNDIEEIRKYYKDKEKKEEVTEINEPTVNDDDFKKYAEVLENYSPSHYVDDECDISEEGYVNIIESRDYSNGVTFEDVKKIPHYDFGEEELYDTATLIHYADGVVCDDLGDRVSDVEELVGVDALMWLKESDDQSIFVRNDAMRMDYEIVKDDWKYSDLADSE